VGCCGIQQSKKKMEDKDYAKRGEYKEKGFCQRLREFDGDVDAVQIQVKQTAIKFPFHPGSFESKQFLRDLEYAGKRNQKIYGIKLIQ
jgi:hypothetical protein